MKYLGTNLTKYVPELYAETANADERNQTCQYMQRHTVFMD